jgi:predicted nuclease of predicted toxin-antitoxin system
VLNGHSPKIIWIRSGNLTTKEIVKLMMHNEGIIKKFLGDEDYKDVPCLEID